MSVRIAVAQFAATTDKARNRDEITVLVREAVSDGADVIVLPENAMYSDPVPTNEIASACETLDGPFVQLIRALAAQHRVTVIAGMTEVIDGSEQGSNTLIVGLPDGSLGPVYRKVHLYDAFGYRESDRIRPADFVPTLVPVGDLTLGLLTCYDLRFPEIARALVDAGADVLVYPAAWAVGPGKEDHWTTLLRARAIENTVYVVGAGQSGPGCTGQSAVIDPMGVIVACAGEVAGTAAGPVARERVEAVRGKNPSLANRRFRVVVGVPAAV